MFDYVTFKRVTIINSWPFITLVIRAKTHPYGKPWSYTWFATKYIHILKMRLKGKKSVL